MFALFFVLLVMVFLAWLFKQPAVKGKCGELFVAFRLNTGLDKNIYQVINDVIIPDGNGGTTQIDHIVLSPCGIFVIETKNMKGWIFGDCNQDKWTQNIFHSSTQFQNPFRQNYKHICCLAELTGLPLQYFINTVVFLGGTIKTRDKLPESLLENASQLLCFIHSFKQVQLDKDALDSIRSSILDLRIANTTCNKKQHIRYVQQIIEDDRDRPDPPDFPAAPAAPAAPAVPLCPQCNSRMVLRQAKLNSNVPQTFWGCSRYPACRTIVNIKD